MILRSAGLLIAAVAMAVGGSSGGRSGPPTAAVASPFAAPLAIGVSWYPEQWPEEQWDVDLARMQRAGLTVVRVGEFAWARLEPSDGSFEFAWLDRAIAAAARRGIRVIIGTPTAAPPIWLTEAHPEVLRVNEDGSVEGHGERRQFSFASSTYRVYARRIAAKLAERYGRNPNVVGWQIDNEIGVPSFDREAKARWASWLMARYGSIGALNRRWATEYWSQRYQRFDQVPLKSKGPQNPALILNFHRFVSSVWADYVREQTQVIRAFADSRQFVTTNSTAWNDNFDQYLVHRELDLAAWDDYVPNGRPDWAANALHHDLVRGYLRRNFWVMETQPGRVDWAPTNRSLDPGQTREMAWQAVAHGADAILYWQWRSAPNGQEQYHGTLVGPDGLPMPIYDEIARTAAEFGRMRPFLASSTPVPAEVALVYSQESRWAIEQARHARDYDPVAIMKAWYRPFAVSGIAVDVVPPDADLSRYKLVLAPQLNVVDAGTAARLSTYVRRGGHLLLGPRSGMKDVDDGLWPSRQPGPLSETLGGRVVYYYPLDEKVTIAGGGVEGTTSLWAETLEAIAPDTSVIASYADGGGWLAGKPAMLRREIGRGWIAYIGAVLDDGGQTALTRWAVEAAAVAPPPVAPVAGVETAMRSTAGRTYLFLINHLGTPAVVRLPRGARCVLCNLDPQGKLPGHEVAVFALNGNEPAIPPRR